MALELWKDMPHGWPIFVGAYGLLGSVYPDQAALVEGLWTGDITWDDANTMELWEKYQVFAQEMLEAGVTGLSHDATPARFAATARLASGTHRESGCAST